jgi:arabinosaccharide transport system substrate-binding protein
MKQTEGKWMVQPMPVWESVQSAPTATWGGTGVCVSKAGRYRDFALDFVLWEHLTPEAVIEDYKERNVWPTLKAAWTHPKTKDVFTAPDPWFNKQDVGSIVRDVADKIPKWYNSPFWNEGTDAMTRVGLVPALQGSNPQDPAETLPAAAKEAERIIAFESA